MRVWFVDVQPVGNTMAVILFFWRGGQQMVVFARDHGFIFLFCAFFCLLSGKDSNLSNLPLHLHPIYMHDLLLINGVLPNSAALSSHLW